MMWHIKQFSTISPNSLLILLINCRSVNWGLIQGIHTSPYSLPISQTVLTSAQIIKETFNWSFKKICCHFVWRCQAKPEKNLRFILMTYQHGNDLYSDIKSNTVCVSVLNHFSRVWLFVTLWIVAVEAPLFMRFSRHEYWSGLPCPPSGDLPNPGIEPSSLTSLVLAGGFFTTSANWEAQDNTSNKLIGSLTWERDFWWVSSFVQLG